MMMESYLIIETHMWSRKNHLQLRLVIQWSFHHYRNKLAERYFDSQLFFLSRHRFKERFLELWAATFWRIAIYLVHKNVQVSIYYFNLLKSNGEHSISYKVNENRYKYLIGIKTSFQSNKNIGGKKDERILYFLRCF